MSVSVVSSSVVSCASSLSVGVGVGVTGGILFHPDDELLLELDELFEDELFEFEEVPPVA